MTHDDAGRPSRDEVLNRACFCITLERPALETALRRETSDPQLIDALLSERPHLFSNGPVFVSKEDLAAMTVVVEALEAAAETPSYQEQVTSWAPEIARRDFGPRGAFMGYDFHLGDDGPRLIEINTNAGGAFLNAALGSAQRACCGGTVSAGGGDLAARFGDRTAAMFAREWRRQRTSGTLSTLAIVDDDPEAQPLLPEFRLAQAVLERHGIRVVLADPRELAARAGALWHGETKIDLVYNRLVDFALEQPAHAALRAAYVNGDVVVTPNPHVHAVLADKRNLTLLSDPAALRRFDVGEKAVEILEASVPRTVIVTPDRAEALWADRRNLFFKPARGYGSKATYSGAKLTKRVWSEIVAGEYVAQDFAPPGQRRVVRDGVPIDLKVDVRLYTYEGAVLLVAARLYQGQTTNMRTPGGGFAPVLETAD